VCIRGLVFFISANACITIITLVSFQPTEEKFSKAVDAGGLSQRREFDIPRAREKTIPGVKSGPYHTDSKEAELYTAMCFGITKDTKKCYWHCAKPSYVLQCALGLPKTRKNVIVIVQLVCNTKGIEV